MKSRKFMVAALISGLAIGAVSAPAWALNPDHEALKAAAQKTLADVTLDVDKAETRLPSNSTWPQRQYQDEYLLGRQNFQDGKYSDALVHLHKADRIIRSMPYWSHIE